MIQYSYIKPFNFSEHSFVCAYIHVYMYVCVSACVYLHIYVHLCLCAPSLILCVDLNIFHFLRTFNQRIHIFPEFSLKAKNTLFSTIEVKITFVYFFKLIAIVKKAEIKSNRIFIQKNSTKFQGGFCDVESWTYTVIM